MKNHDGRGTVATSMVMMEGVDVITGPIRILEGSVWEGRKR